MKAVAAVPFAKQIPGSYDHHCNVFPLPLLAEVGSEGCKWQLCDRGILCLL